MTANEYQALAIEAHRKGQALITQFDIDRKSLSADQAAARQKEITAQASAFFDEAERHSASAEAALRSEQIEKKLAAPERKFPFADPGRYENAGAPGDLRSKMLASPEYKSAILAYLTQGDRALANPAHAKMLLETKALSPLTDPEGGFLLNTEQRTEVIRKLRNLVFIRAHATEIGTQAAQVTFPTFDPADSQTAPSQVQPNAAIPQLSLSNVFGKTAFTPHKKAEVFQIPMELIEDAAVDVTALLTDFMAMRFAEVEENDFINGTGVNAPVGLVTALTKNSLPSVAIAGTGTAMVPEDIVKTVYGMRAVYRTGASWLMHRLVVQAVRLFRTDIGGAGTGMFMFQPSMQAGQPPTLFGYPLYESEFFTNPYAGSAGAPMMMFGDLKYYWIVDRIDLMIQRLNELYAANDQVGFRLRKRYDAAPVLADPFLFLTRN